MRKMILLSAYIMLLPALAFCQKGSEAYTPCKQESFRDSMVINNPFHYLDSVDIQKLSSVHPKGWNGKTVYLSKKLSVESFQLLPWIGTYTLKERSFDISYCGEWHISKGSSQYATTPEEQYLIGLLFFAAYLILLITITLKIPRRGKLPLLTHEFKLEKYKNNFFGTDQAAKYIYAIVIACVYPIRLVLMEQYSFSTLLVLSMLWWIMLMIITSYLFRNLLINYRLGKLK